MNLQQRTTYFTPDPFAQDFSPYSGMGNNPVAMVDPTGGRWLIFVGWEEYSTPSFDAGSNKGPSGRFVYDLLWIDDPVSTSGWADSRGCSGGGSGGSADGYYDENRPSGGSPYTPESYEGRENIVKNDEIRPEFVQSVLAMANNKHYGLRYSPGGGDPPKGQKAGNKPNVYTVKTIPIDQESAVKWMPFENIGFNVSANYRGMISIQQLSNGRWYAKGFFEIQPYNVSSNVQYSANIRVLQDGSEFDYDMFSTNILNGSYLVDSDWTQLGWGYVLLPIAGNVEIRLTIMANTYEFWTGHKSEKIYESIYILP